MLWTEPFEPACHGLMLAVAAVASFTDLRRGVIPNRLVVWGLVAAALLQLGAALAAGPEPGLGAASWARLGALALNAGVGLGLAVGLFWVGLLSAGDAKLAIVLAAAQPAWVALRGPVPWAPVLVLLGNALLAALVFVAAEAAVRGLPRLVAAARRGGLASAAGRLGGLAATAARVGLAMAALAAALGPLRSWLGGRVGALLPGGAFLTFAILFVLYRPLRSLALRRGGLLAALAVLAVSSAVTVRLEGLAGTAGIGRALLVAGAVILARGALSLASRSFDSRRLGADELRPGAVLAPAFVDRLEADRRWKEAFAPFVGELRGVRLDQNLLDNVREWHAHNAPAEPVAVRSSLPFAPALAAGVLLTAWARGLVFHF